MLLLRNKDQQQKNPLPIVATQWSINELQAHYCMTPGPWTRFLCSVSYRQINCHCKKLIIYWKLSGRFHVF